jgi:hypothetical protein
LISAILDWRAYCLGEGGFWPSAREEPMRLCLVLLTLLSAAAPADAQTPAPRSQRPAPDFLFGRPSGWAGVRGSWLLPRAGSDWYDFVTDQLTLDNGDFRAPAIAADLGFVLAPRLDGVIGIEYGRSKTLSEYRNFVDNNRLPIEQLTTVKQLNISGSIKVPLVSRGREITRLVWIPKTVVPYAGAGGGVMWYSMEQTGDFVDYFDLSVFSDIFRSNGWTPSAHVFGGVDVRIFRSWFITVDARYLWAAGDLGRDWIDFDPIDLTGTHLSVGFNVVF